jgi:hypothetical protein
MKDGEVIKVGSMLTLIGGFELRQKSIQRPHKKPFTTLRGGTYPDTQASTQMRASNRAHKGERAAPANFYVDQHALARRK